MIEGHAVRFDPRALLWGLAAVVLSLGCGLAVAAAPAVAFDVSAVALAALAIRRWPLPALLLIVLVRAAVPNSVLVEFLTLGGGGLALLGHARKLPGRRVTVPLLALLLIALASVPFLPSPDEGSRAGSLLLPLIHIPYASSPSNELFEWTNLATVLVVFGLAAWAVRSRAHLNAVVAAILASALIPLMVGMSQLASGQTVRRTGSTLASIRGPFTFPNYFGFYLLVIVALGIVMLFESRTRLTRGASGAVVAAAGVALFLTYTRSAWIALAAVLLVLALTRYRRLLAVGVLLAVTAVLIAPGAVKKAETRFGDLASKSEATASNSWTWRVNEWNAVLPYGWQRPLTGQGFGSYPRMTVRRFGHSSTRYPTIEKPALGVFSPEGFTAHNDYVRMFVELGIPGLLLWVLTLVGAATTALRARRVADVRGVATGTGVIILALGIVSFSDNLQGYAVVLMYAFVLCGALAGVAQRSRGRTAGGPRAGSG